MLLSLKLSNSMQMQELIPVSAALLAWHGWQIPATDVPHTSERRGGSNLDSLG